MRGLRRVFQIVLLLAAVAIAAWLSVRWQGRVDLSFGQRASLAPASRSTLNELPGAVEVVSYARPDGELRGAIAAFVARYQQDKPDLTLAFVNPDADPQAMRARGISVDGEIELRYRERSQRLTQLNERAFTAALLRLARPAQRLVAFIVGHGERRPDGDANHDLQRFGQALAEQGARAVTLDFAQTAALPDNVDLLVLAGPQTALTPGEEQRIVRWVDDGGALLWLTDPTAPEHAALARALGVMPLAGRVVDAAAQGLGIDDPSFVAVSSYPPHAITSEFALTTLLPQAVAFAQGAGAGFSARPLLRSGARSWNETGAIEGAIAYDAGGDELPGPHDLALALTRLSPRPDRSEQRIVVVGDGDFLANSHLGNGGNRDLGLRIVNWLLQDEALLDLAPQQAPDRALVLSEGALAGIGLWFLIGLPALLLATGAIIVWRRRRR